jgi:hypothetical protein
MAGPTTWQYKSFHLTGGNWLEPPICSASVCPVKAAQSLLQRAFVWGRNREMPGAWRGVEGVQG